MLNHASRTRSLVGLVCRPAGVLRRRPLKSPAMMRSKTRHSGLNRDAALPIVSLQSEGHIQRLAQPFLGDVIGPLETDRWKDGLPVVECKSKVVRPDTARADGACVAHPEHGSRIPRSAGLEMTQQPLEVRADFVQLDFEIDALLGSEIVGCQQLTRDTEKRETEPVEAIATDRKARGHRMATVLLEMGPDALKRA